MFVKLVIIYVMACFLKKSFNIVVLEGTEVHMLKIQNEGIEKHLS
jgi:hypothetical protein